MQRAKGGACSAVTVVDIADGDTGRAAGQRCTKGRLAITGGAISGGGWNADHNAGDQSAQYAHQGRVHACHGDNDGMRLDLAQPAGQPPQAGDAHIEEQCCLFSVELKRT